MPKGKIYVAGAIGWLPKLPDCSNLDFLFRHRIKSAIEYDATKEENYRRIVNEAVKRYFASILTARPTTYTVRKKAYSSVELAAKAVLRSIQVKNSNRIKLWMKKLADRTTYAKLGHYDWIYLNKLLRCGGGNIGLLNNYEILSHPQALPLKYLKTLEILSTVSLENFGINKICDPFLLELIASIVPIWLEVTGSTPLPKTKRKNKEGRPERDDGLKTNLFAGWIDDLVFSGNDGLKREHEERCKHAKLQGHKYQLVSPPTVNPPKEGTILDVVRLLKKTEKSGIR